MREPSFLQVMDLKKSFNGTDVLKNFSANIERGEFVGVFGPNGCGKTTLLKIVAGMIKPDTGKVLIESEDSSKKKIGLINQDYENALMPWLTCIENILFPYTLNGNEIGKKQAKRRLFFILSRFKISLPLKNYPYQLSGGQQQLALILRAVLYNPDILLFDEPFSSLDEETRNVLKKIIMELWKKEKLTILFVSHNMDDLLYFTRKIILFPSDFKKNKPKLIKKNF